MVYDLRVGLKLGVMVGYLVIFFVCLFMYFIKKFFFFGYGLGFVFFIDIVRVFCFVWGIGIGGVFIDEVYFVIVYNNEYICYK